MEILSSTLNHFSRKSNLRKFLGRSTSAKKYFPKGKLVSLNMPIIYSEECNRCKYIANGIARHCFNIMNGNNEVGKMRTLYLLPVSKRIFRILKQAWSSLRVTAGNTNHYTTEENTLRVKSQCEIIQSLRFSNLDYFDKVRAPRWNIHDAYNEHTQNMEVLTTQQKLDKFRVYLEKKNDKIVNKWLKTWTKFHKEIIPTSEKPEEPTKGLARPFQNMNVKNNKKVTIVNNFERPLEEAVESNSSRKRAVSAAPTREAPDAPVPVPTPSPSTSSVPTLTRQLSEDGHKSRQYVFNYLVKVSLNWLPRLYWVLNNADYTDMFQEYRKLSLFLAANKQNLSNNRVLSFGNVFVVRKSRPDSYSVKVVHGFENRKV